MSDVRPDAERFRAIEVIFHGALGLKGAERAAYLHQACGADEGLRSQVENLLRTDAETGESFLLSPGDEQQVADRRAVERLADYEILGELGRGGMGIVYRARQPHVGRVVALKVILGGQMATPGEVARFQRETRAAASLDHPNIVPIYEVGEAGGVHYYSMRVLEGGTIARPRAPLERSPEAGARLLEKIALAVHFAHEHGVLHRDLKPANLLLDGTGEPYVADFGLARPLDTDGSLTLTGQMVGTASYMAPEQVSGKKAPVSRAGDVYSLGAILYELLTRRPPFQGDSAFDTLEKVLHEEPRRPRSLSPGIPADLERICLKCLEKEPRRRYPTAAALAMDLRRFLNREPVTARPIGPAARTWRWCRRNPAAVTILLCLVLTASVAGGSAFLWRSQRDAALINLRVSYREQARAGRWSRRAGQRVKGLELISAAARLGAAGDLRDEAIACMACCDLVVEKSWEGAPPGTQAVAFDAALEHYARAAESGRVSIRRVLDDAELTSLAATGALVTGLFFSPDGRYLAARQHRLEQPGDLSVWDWRGGKRVVFLDGAIPGEAFDFSPLGGRLAAGQLDGSIRLYDLGPEEGSRGAQGPGREAGSVIPPAGRMAAETLAFAPDGRRLLAAARATSTVHIVDLESAARSKDLQFPGHVGAVAWHPGGRHFGVACQGIGLHSPRDLNVYFSGVDDDQAPLALRGHGSLVVALAFNHAGDLLASASWDGTLRLWHPFSGEELVKAASPMTSARGLHFSADDTLLGYCRSGSILSLYRPVVSDEHFLFRGDTGAMYSALSISPDGRLLASSAGPVGVKIWCVATRRELAHLQCGSVYWLVFQPGTGHLITSSAAGLGLHVWPVEENGGRPGHVRVGPPRRIAEEIAFPRWLSVSGDGRYLAVLKGTSEVVVLDLTSLASPFLVLTHPHVQNAHLSHDGRWLATTSDNTSEVWIWDRPGGKQVAELPAALRAGVDFDAEGRRLAISTTEECCLWEVGSWRRLKSFAALTPGANPAWVAFSTHGRMLALTDASGIVRLFEPASGTELARLDVSAVQPIGTPCFGRSDTLLTGSRLNRIDLWDLVRIRKRLREMGLDWTEDPLPPEPEPGSALEVEVDLGELGSKAR